MHPATLRHGRPEDAAAIATILNHYIVHTTSTFHTEPVGVDDRTRWIVERKPEHPLWVAEHGGQLLGWAALSEHRPRGAWRHTVEHSVYLHPAHTGLGLGTRLLSQVIADARAGGFHTLVAGACADQAASLALHERAGFERVALFREVAYKLGRWLDVVYLQLMLGPPADARADVR